MRWVSAGCPVLTERLSFVWERLLQHAPGASYLVQLHGDSSEAVKGTLLLNSGAERHERHRDRSSSGEQSLGAGAIAGYVNTFLLCLCQSLWKSVNLACDHRLQWDERAFALQKRQRQETCWICCKEQATLWKHGPKQTDILYIVDTHFGQKDSLHHQNHLMNTFTCFCLVRW